MFHPKSTRKQNHCSVGTCCSECAHSAPVLFCDISWFLSFFFFSAWVICPLHPLGKVWLTALDARPSQLRLVTQKKSVLSWAIDSANIYGFNMCQLLSLRLSQQTEVGTITPATLKVLRTCSRSWT